MTEPNATPHPLERFPGATRTVTAPMTGLPVVIRKVDFDAITLDSARFVLSGPAMREVAQEWAARATEEMKEDGETPRPRGSLPPEAELEIQREASRAALRCALLRPTLDELVAEYGGSLDEADLGLGSDFSWLAGEVSAFSKPQPTPAQKEQARTFPVDARSGAAWHSKDLWEAAKRTDASGAGDT